jgi:hypothetical protein
MPCSRSCSPRHYFPDSVSDAGASRRIVLDVDPGIDDALAMLLAMHSRELRIEAITVVSGT